MVSYRRLRVAAGVAVAGLVAVIAASAGTSATNQNPKLVIWADSDRGPAAPQGDNARARAAAPARAPAVTQVASAWARAKGVTVQVVQKQQGPIRQEVSTVAVENAPDV